VSIDEARAEMKTISARLEAAYPDTNAKRGVEISPLQVETYGQLQPIVLTLMAAVSFVLLIACANVANLLIGRSEARQKEIAVRTALGAGRARLIRQMITESCVLTTIGAVAGLLVAQLLVRVGTARQPRPVPIVRAADAEYQGAAVHDRCAVLAVSCSGWRRRCMHGLRG
jgi:putative ABC transport system permease protein